MSSSSGARSGKTNNGKKMTMDKTRMLQKDELVIVEVKRGRVTFDIKPGDDISRDLCYVCGNPATAWHLWLYVRFIVAALRLPNRSARSLRLLLEGP